MKKVKRLAHEFRPEHYKLWLNPDREAKQFQGKVTISGRKVGKPSKRITLHQKGLKFAGAKLIKKDKKGNTSELVVSRLNCHSGFDEVRLHADEILYPGEYEIYLEFSGHITDAMHGIYPCRFRHNGKDKQLIATQFESHHAREAFPCIDEPEAKATFDLSLQTPAGETVLGNTPIKKQTTKDGLLTTVFETSPKMSTYLLAFAYGETVKVSSQTKAGVAVNCYGTPLAKGQLDFSLDVAIKSLEFFEDYFGVAYPLPKLDMIALPDFSSGAMENWGLVTYRESVMLIDPKVSGIETKQIAALVIAHELSHQWFGNLVTMKWWDDLWLNESFANLMEYRAVDEMFPKWNIFEQFVNTEMNMAMRRDALPNVQSVRTEVRHPDEIGSLFDPAIVYAKGGSILRMLMHYVGEEAFRKALANYFKKHAYSNTVADDLWAALSASSGKDISQFMNNWLTKPGYPVISVDHQPGSSQAQLEQERLVIGEDTSTITWSVPLAANCELDTPTLNSAKESFKLSAPIEPLLLNHEGQSYFVPRYINPEHFDSILESLKSGQISTIDRLLLLMHGSIMESAGLVATTDNLQLAAALKSEQDEPVWTAIAGVVASARRLVVTDEPSEADLNNFIKGLVGPAVKLVGWTRKPSDSAQTERLRNLILGMAAGAQEPLVLTRAKELFAKLSKPADLAPDIRGTVYFVGARHGKQADFDKLLKLYKDIDNADEKDEIASALISSRSPKQIDALLQLLTTEYVRLQDLPRWFAWLMRNQYATAATWDWLKNHWSWVEEKYGDDKSFDAFPRYAASAFSRPAELTAYTKFFEPKRADPALTRVVDLGIEEITGRIAWRKRNESAVKDWLKTKPQR